MLRSECLTLLRSHLTIISSIYEVVAKVCRGHTDDYIIAKIRERAQLYRKAAESVEQLSDDEIMLLSSVLPVEKMRALLDLLEECARETNIELYLEVRNLKRRLIEEGEYRKALINLHTTCDPYAEKITQYMLREKQ